jgi:hypothetical protein
MAKSGKPGRGASGKKQGATASANRRSAATWDGLFGRAESLTRGEAKFRALAREGTPAAAAPAAPATQPGQVQALVGIWWTDPTFPIFYDIIINSTPLPAPNSSRTGEVIRTVMLRRGQANIIGWSIQHMGQGWKHRLFLKLNDEVIPLESAEDPSPDDESDDLTSGSKVINVPA